MHDDCRRRLLGHELKLLREGNADPLGPQQVEELLLIFEPGTCRVTKAVAGALVLLVKQFFDLPCISAADAEFLPNSRMPQFCKRLRAFHAQPVKVEILLVIVLRKETPRMIGGDALHCHQMEGYDVHAAEFFGAK